MATTGYFGGGLNKVPGATLDQVYADYKNDTANQAATRAELAAIAAQWGLNLVAYEAGSVARFRAARSRARQLTTQNQPTIAQIPFSPAGLAGVLGRRPTWPPTSSRSGTRR